MALTKVDDRGLKTPIDLQDNEMIRLGDSADLKLYHDGSQSFILETGTGPLNIKSSQVNIQAANGDNQINCVQDAEVQLRYDGNKTFETTTNGADLTGSSTFAQVKLKTSDGTNRGGLYASNANNLFLLDGQDHQFIQMVKDGEVIIKHDNVNKLKTYPTGVEIIGALYATSVDLNDDQKVLLGTGDDLQLYHNGNNSFIENSTGNLHIKGKAGEESIVAIPDGAVQLYYNNSQKLYTANSGVGVIGNIYLTDSSNTNNGRLVLGATSDLQIYHDGTHSRLNNTTGTLVLQSDTISLTNNAGNSNRISTHSSGEVKLYHSDSLKLETTSTGILTTGTVAGHSLLLGTQANTYPVIQRHTTSAGSQNLTITAGAGLPTNSGSAPTINDALNGGAIQISGGNPTSDVYGGGIKYYANGHTSPNSGGAGNQHAFYTRTSANTYTEAVRINEDGYLQQHKLVAVSYSDTRELAITNADLTRSNFYNTANFESDSNILDNNGHFIAPVHGIYRLFVRISTDDSGGNRSNIRLRKNGNTINEAYSTQGSNIHQSVSSEIIMELNAGEYLDVQAAQMHTMSGSQHKVVNFHMLG